MAMSFTPGFENDIFISFCHYDNAAPSNEKGWVDLFHEGLESWLVRRFGHKKVSIWRDKELQGNTLFDDRIREQIRKSALFFALLSPNYLKSEYCLKELEWFHREAGKSRCGLSVNNECRIFNVLLNNVHHSQWLKQLQGTSGFPMHDQKEVSKNRGEFLDYHDHRYNRKLRPIVDAVETILNLFPGAAADDMAKRNQVGEEFPEAEVLRIFIADTADSLQHTRDKLVADLTGEGGKETHILRKIPPPWDGPGHEAAVKQAVDEADLVVHLLGGWPGRKMEEAKALTFPCAQVEIALRSRTRNWSGFPKTLNLKISRTGNIRNSWSPWNGANGKRWISNLSKRKRPTCPDWCGKHWPKSGASAR
jgi:hypothetical protein